MRILLKLFKILLLTVGGLIILLQLVLVTVLNLDYNPFKNEISALISDAIGRKVEVKGNLHIRLSSITPSIEATDVHLANAPWGALPDTIAFKTLKVKLDFTHILSTRIDLLLLELDKARINVESNKKGQSNFDFLTMATKALSPIEKKAAEKKKKAAEKKAQEAAKRAKKLGKSAIHAPVFDFVLHDLRVNDVRLVIKKYGAKDDVFAGLDYFYLKKFAKGDTSLKLDVKGNYEKRPILLTGKVGSIQDLLQPSPPWTAVINGDIAGNKLTLSGQVHDVINLKGINLLFDFKGNNLPQFNKVAGVKLPDIGKYAIKGDISGSLDNLAMSNLHVTSHNGKAFNLDIGGKVGSLNKFTNIDVNLKITGENFKPFEGLAGMKLPDIGGYSIKAQAVGKQNKVKLQNIDIKVGSAKKIQAIVKGSLENANDVEGLNVTYVLNSPDIRVFRSILKPYEKSLGKKAKDLVPDLGGLHGQGEVKGGLKEGFSVTLKKFRLGRPQIGEITAKGGITNVQTFEGLNFAIGIDTHNLSTLSKKLAPLIGGDVLPNLGKVKITARVHGIPGKTLMVSDLKLKSGTVGLVSLNAKGSYNVKDENLNLTGELKGPHLSDLKTVLKPYGDIDLPNLGPYDAHLKITGNPLGKLVLTLPSIKIGQKGKFYVVGHGGLDDVTNVQGFHINFDASGDKLSQLHSYLKAYDVSPLPALGSYHVKGIVSGEFKKQLKLHNVVVSVGTLPLLNIKAQGGIRNLLEMTGLKFSLKVKGHEVGDLNSILKAYTDIKIPKIGPINLQAVLEGKNFDKLQLMNLKGFIGDKKIARLKLSSNIPDLLNINHMDTDLDLTIANLSIFSDIIPLPNTKAFHLKAKIKSSKDGKAFSLPKFIVSAGSSHVTGKLDIDFSTPVLVVNADLKAKYLNLNDFMPIKKKAPKKKVKKTTVKKKPAPKKKAASKQKKKIKKSNLILPNKPLPLGKLRKIQANIRLQTGRFSYSGGDIDNLNLRVTAKNGLVKLSPFVGRVGRGNFRGHVLFDAQPKNGNDAKLNILFQMRGADVGRLIGMAGYRNLVKGPLKTDIHLTSHGGTVAKILGNLNGDIQLFMNKGAIESKVLKRAAGATAASLARIMLGSSDNGEIPLKCVAINIPFKQGRSDIKVLLFKTAATDIEVGGFVDLKKENLSLIAIPKGFLPIGSASIPVRITGALGSPIVYPDIGIITTSIAAYVFGGIVFGSVTLGAQILGIGNSQFCSEKILTEGTAFNLSKILNKPGMLIGNIINKGVEAATGN